MQSLPCIIIQVSEYPLARTTKKITMKKIILLFTSLTFCAFNMNAQTDYDGNIYNTVTIGTQVWLNENLKVTHYNNGDPIPLVLDNSEWSTLSTGAYSYYNNELNNLEIYGGLYNWYTIAEGNLCPIDYHVPTNDDWTILFNYLTENGYGYGGSGDDFAKSLAATSGWMSTETPGTIGNDQGSNNSTGFTALPGGDRGLDGFSYDIGTLGLFWSSSEINTDNADYKYLSSYNSIVVHSGRQKNAGLSVRCVRNSTTTNVNEWNNDEEILIYPNPANDRIYINCIERQNVKIQVYNFIGECVMQAELSSGTNEIDISSLSKGIYVINLIGINWPGQKIIIKE